MATDPHHHAPERADELAPDLYAELRRIAGRCLRRERGDHTLQATALVHEAWMHIDPDSPARQDRARFLRLAAQAMRNLLISHARKRNAHKRQGGRERISLTRLPGGFQEPEVDVLALNELLEKLAEQSPRKAQIVELRFFGGCTIEETAEALGISTPTVEREWRFTRAWLADRLAPGPEGSAAHGP